MSRTLLALFVVMVWVGLTGAAAAFVPERQERNQEPDLSVDPVWQARAAPFPAYNDKRPPPITAPTTTTAPPTTTTTRHTTPPPTTRTTTPRPPPRPRVANTGGVEQWRAAVAAYGDWNTDLMLSIMRCESGGRPDAYNRSSASGLFQILGGPFDPTANIALAHSMWSTRGTQPWNASRSCWG